MKNFGNEEERQRLLNGAEHEELEKSIISLSQQEEEVAVEIGSIEKLVCWLLCLMKTTRQTDNQKGPPDKK